MVFQYFSILLDFTREANEFVALSSVTNVLWMLEKALCEHMEDFRKRSFTFDSLKKLGEPLKSMSVAS